MEEDKLNKLKELAQKATPGPWEQDACGGVYSEAREDIPLDIIDDCLQSPDDAAYIAAANPQTMLAMIAKIEELEKDNANLSEYLLGASNNLDLYGKAINWICLALGIKTPTPIDFFFKDGARPIIERIKDINLDMREMQNYAAKDREEINKLEKEADWLAEQLSYLANRLFSDANGNLVSSCPENASYKPVFDCVAEHGSCKDCWRQAARKAVEEQ